jgi:DNA-binding CsgD family transcriptional regulator
VVRLCILKCKLEAFCRFVSKFDKDLIVIISNLKLDFESSINLLRWGIKLQPFLSEREKEVALLIAKGYKDTEIAKQLFISRRRVGEIVSSIKNKFQVSSRVKIGILVYHMGWLDIKEIIKEEEYAKKSTIY